jgi:hypothetical protein
MNAIVVRSPRNLSRPRRVAITGRSPVAAMLKSLAAAVVRDVHGATALADRVPQEPVAPRPQARWVASRQVDSPEPPATVAPAAPVESNRIQVRKFWDIFD